MSVSRRQIAALSESKPTETAATTLDELYGLEAEPQSVVMVGERLLAVQAMRILMRLDRELVEARAQFNQDWFRRVMRVRSKAASRLRRRWGKVNPPPAISLGNLRRRYHANLARHLYQPRGK